MDCPVPFLPLQLQFNSLCIISIDIQPLWFYIYVFCSNRTILLFFHVRNCNDDGRHFFKFVDSASLWFMKASLPEVKQLTGKCFRIVRIVTKNNLFEIKISRPTPIDSLSVELFSLGLIKHSRQNLASEFYHAPFLTHQYDNTAANIYFATQKLNQLTHIGSFTRNTFVYP